MKEKLLIKDFLYDDFEQSYKIYNEKFEYYSILYDNIMKIKIFIEKFFKDKIDNLKLKEEIHSPSSFIDENYDKLILLMKEDIIINIKGSLSVINEILINLTNVKKTIKSNIKNFTEYLQSQYFLNSKLIELNSIKKKYFQTAQKAESFTIEFFEKKINDQKTDPLEFTKKNELQNSSKEYNEKYINKIKEINQFLQIFNEKQRFIFNINKVIKISIYENYINSLFSFYQYASDESEVSTGKKELKKKIFDLTNQKEILKQTEFDENKCIKKIDFIQYQTKINFNNCFDNREITIYIIASEEMKKYIGGYINVDFEHYRIGAEIKNKVIDILNLDDKLNEEGKKYIESIIETDIGEQVFIHCLSQLRTNGKFEKSKKFVEFIGEIMAKLIDYQKKKNNFKYMKSCLILSQTFYYINLSNEKVYIQESLLNHKWLKSANFWRNLIDSVLKNEFNKNNANKLKKSDLLFTQLMPFVNNMNEFNIDNRIIIKVIDEFLIKYNYKDLVKSDEIFAMIIKDKNEIHKLRKEYQDDPDLEYKLYKDELKENENNNKDNNIEKNVDSNTKKDD